MSATRADAIADAFAWACALDVLCAKPGNVSFGAPGHRMTADLFIASAQAAGPAVTACGASVGERIERAVSLSMQAAGCNTNLGIVLLCAPLAHAFENLRTAHRAPTAHEAHLAVRDTLSRLDLNDACAAYRAIALANPGGLGEAPSQSVGTAPTVDLLSAMTLARDRDSIARQYASGFADVLGYGVIQLRAALGAAPIEVTDQPRLLRAVLKTWLAFLSHWPDSHIARKHGIAVARAMTRDARAWHMQTALDFGKLAAWDDALKCEGINPGTTADLTVATLFAAACLDPSLLHVRCMDAAVRAASVDIAAAG
ncbi:triphosphoribosyl-dephospho-CoA synthase [Paraburkholderia phymatum]|uniref:Triphosphoribosyl-dephospho-CoA protein n=1 Tax=Paraburkholderia phymatum (strain DSM 17167 / CIP 108236 / LMG 21445 / STM815) TaxID=391038 RepID=B2JVN1_PARP8|nr:triphosphoribosyl-dephospho-CoA synthase [Paraburkholderia phymatum]ACC75008.1 triphosphoribosyl-dephospho-CoA protein [Paraburkholderia phymatum STM815]